MDATLADILPRDAAFDPASDAAFFAAVPARWGVALLCDASGGALQLLCAKNLRATLRRRLEAPDESLPAAPSKRVDYRELVRSARWARVDSEFEMDLVYVDAARLAFPAHWRRLVPERSAHFVGIDPDDRAPDLVRNTTPTMKGHVFGPFSDRAKADRWAETVRDAFDLCRYRNILAQAPRGRACAYKQMNKCPAPCDGSISMDDFRANNVRPAIEAARDPSASVARLNDEMRAHAVALEFEQAGRAKQRAATIESLSAGGVRPIESFRYVGVQPGARKGTAKLFLATIDGVAEVAAVLDEATPLDDVAAVLYRASVPHSAWPRDLLLGTLCFHLAGAKTAARFIERDRLDATALRVMLKAAMKVEAKVDDAEPVRETRLQASL